MKNCECGVCGRELSLLEIMFYQSLFTQIDDTGLPFLCPNHIENGKDRFVKWKRELGD